MTRIVILALLLVPALAGAADPAPQRLERLAAEAYERALDLFPFGETFGRGAGPRQDRLELTLTQAHRERQRAHHRWVLEALASIAPAELGESERITHELLGLGARRALEGLEHPLHRHFAFIHLNGGVAFDLVQLAVRQPLRDEADARAWFRRLQRYPALFRAAEQTMREGMASGITTPRVLAARALAQLEALAPEEAEKSSLWTPIARFPALQDEYRGILARELFPAIRALAGFVRNEYLPAARTTDGFGALPDGERMYRLMVRYGTTTDVAPDEVHELGLREVARIRPLFLAAGERAGFKGPMRELRAWLVATPENYPFTTPEQVIAHLEAIHARIVPQLPKLFSRLPKARFEIRPTDPAIAASAPAQYYAPADDGSRPGIFAMPIVEARRVSVFGLAALLAHEGMPGHHLETGIKLENPVPEFRRRAWHNAFGEGWALYAESLGEELGLYAAPLDLMGRYSYELFRACRLVVDTGLHAKGWRRERAIAYLVEECGSGRGGATDEVLRYMAWPGQALGYKIGELTIWELRREAEKRLGARFDLRAFHDAVLGEGHMPLSMLRGRMRAWIAAREAKPL
jgi:uncharacterized protein (DUF885 family)